MTCPKCAPLCATTEGQLAIRQANVKHYPDVKVHPCGACGGIDWATTDEWVVKSIPTRWEKFLRGLFSG